MNHVAQPVPAASWGSVPLLARTRGETPPELAGEDARRGRLRYSCLRSGLNSYAASCSPEWQPWARK